MTRSNSKNRVAKAKRKREEKLEFVQPFLPVKDIRNGIVETTDGRYIKILEIEPINFMLRSSEEQYNILSSFASWLKISPMKLQFKSITRKADSDKHVAMIRKELEKEDNEQCKTLSEDYIRLIKDVGSREALPSYDYTTESRTYFVPDETLQSEVPVTQTAYKAVTVMLPVYTNGRLTSTRNATYYEENGTETLEPTIEIIKYVECTIHPFDNTVIADAFDIDLSAEYPTFNITYGEAIRNMADALKMTLYGSLGSGESIPLTDAELLGIVGSQNCNDTRKLILTTALSLVGKVPYFWGGKSEAGWNDEWNKPNRNDPLLLFFFIGDRKHDVADIRKCFEHIIHASILLL